MIRTLATRVYLEQTLSVTMLRKRGNAADDDGNDAPFKNRSNDLYIDEDDRRNSMRIRRRFQCRMMDGRILDLRRRLICLLLLVCFCLFVYMITIFLLPIFPVVIPIPAGEDITVTDNRVRHVLSKGVSAFTSVPASVKDDNHKDKDIHISEVTNFFDVSLFPGGFYSNPLENFIRCHEGSSFNVAVLQAKTAKRHFRRSIDRAIGSMKTIYYFNDTMMDRIGCDLPQWSLLSDIHQFDNNATLLLNIQSAEDWLEGISNQLGSPKHWYLPLDVRISRCWSHLDKMLNLTSAQVNERSSLNDRLKFLYKKHSIIVRKFVEDHQSHNLVEYTIPNSSNSTVSKTVLEEVFSVSLINDKCWSGQAEENGNIPVSLLATHDYERIYPELNHKDKLRLQKSSGIRNHYNITKLPILTVGLPKAGTTSVDHFFRCYDLRVSHNFCYDNHFDQGVSYHCSSLLQKNEKDERPLLHFTGEYDLYAQYDSVADCFFPQITHLDKIHQDYPDATLILNTRDVDAWIASIKRWKHVDSGYVPLDVRFARCFDKMPEWVGVGIHTDDISVDEKLRRLFFAQIKNVRTFAEKYNHDLVELKIDAPRAGKKLRDHFFGGYGWSSCWGQSNTAKERGLEGSQNKSSNAIFETINSDSPKKDHSYVNTTIPLSSKIVMEIHTARSRLKESSPILAFGLSEQTKNDIFKFLQCNGQRVASDYCFSNIFNKGNKYRCSDLIQSNIRNQFPTFHFTGDYDAYLSLRVLDQCLLPGIDVFEAIHSHYPNATFLVEAFDIERIASDTNSEIHGTIEICMSTNRNQMETHVNASMYQGFEAFALRKYQELEMFVEKNPSHSIVTIKPDAFEDRTELESYYRKVFYGENPVNVFTSCL